MKAREKGDCSRNPRSCDLNSVYKTTDGGATWQRISNNKRKSYCVQLALAYTEDSGQTINLDLAGDKDYTLQDIDTWNMKIVSERTVSPGEFQHKTVLPFTALRIVARL